MEIASVEREVVGGVKRYAASPRSDQSPCWRWLKEKAEGADVSRHVAPFSEAQAPNGLLPLTGNGLPKGKPTTLASSQHLKAPAALAAYF